MNILSKYINDNNYLSDTTLAKVQAGSGLGFSSFLVLHLTNAIALNSGEMGWDGVREFFRIYYQNQVVELFTVFGSLLVHMGSSSIIYYRRTQRQKKLKREDGENETKKRISLPLPLKLHRWSGYVLSAFTFAHIFAVRWSTMIWELDVDFQFLSWGLVKKPLIMFPYYLLFSFSGIYHLSYGIPQSIRVIYGVKIPEWVTPRRPYFWIWNAAVGLGVFAGLLSLSGQFSSINTSRFSMLDQQLNTKIGQVLSAAGLHSLTQ